jgi:hypothetical protein
MMTSDKTILIFDSGTNTDFAIKMTEFYGKVLYYSPYEEAYPTPYKGRIGTGIEGVERVYNVWDYFDSIDIWAFPHLFHGAFQEWLRSIGKLVFGAGKGEILETDRIGFKELQKDLGMPLNNYKVIQGFDEMEEHLKINEDLFIKNNLYRGVMETWHHENYKTSKPFLDFLRTEYGMFQKEERFIIETPIDDAVEYGFDGLCIDGKFTKKTVFGVEIKDTAYLCKSVDYKDLPKAVLDANEKLSPIMASYGYRGWYSNEMRSISKNEAILTDITGRFASPPTSLFMEMTENFGQYIWDVANGDIPEVKFKYKYGCQLIISCGWAKKEPVAITFPKEYSNNVRIKNLSIVDDVYWFLPQPDEMMQIGYVLGWGNTKQQCFEMAKKVAKEVKGFDIKINISALDEAEQELGKLAKMGINIFA